MKIGSFRRYVGTPRFLAGSWIRWCWVHGLCFVWGVMGGWSEMLEMLVAVVRVICFEKVRDVCSLWRLGNQTSP